MQYGECGHGGVSVIEGVPGGRLARGNPLTPAHRIENKRFFAMALIVSKFGIGFVSKCDRKLLIHRSHPKRELFGETLRSQHQTDYRVDPGDDPTG